MGIFSTLAKVVTAGREVHDEPLRADQIEVGMVLAAGRYQDEMMSTVGWRGETVTEVETDDAGTVRIWGAVPHFVWMLPPDYAVYVVHA